MFCHTSVDVLDVVEHLDGISVEVEFLGDGKGLLEELIINGHIRNVIGIVVLETFDVVHHT